MIKKIIKHMKLNKKLITSSMLNGQSHTGKMALVKSIYDDTKVINGHYFDKYKNVLNKKKEVIIYNFEKIQNIDYIDFDNMQIIAISNYESIPKSIQNKFAFIYEMPSFKTRTNEIKEFIKKISKQAQDSLNVKMNNEIQIDKLDLSKNFQSIEASIYKEIIKQTLSKDDIEEILYIYLYSKLKNEDESKYKILLSIFEKPLIKAGLQRYKSTLKLSKILGINRNTLSNKVKQNAIK
jgi:DNA-binding protein Fis